MEANVDRIKMRLAAKKKREAEQAEQAEQAGAGSAAPDTRAREDLERIAETKRQEAEAERVRQEETARKRREEVERKRKEEAERKRIDAIKARVSARKKQEAQGGGGKKAEQESKDVEQKSKKPEQTKQERIAAETIERILAATDLYEVIGLIPRPTSITDDEVRKAYLRASVRSVQDIQHLMLLQTTFYTVHPRSSPGPEYTQTSAPTRRLQAPSSVWPGRMPS
jgi:hypothetical protein